MRVSSLFRLLLAAAMAYPAAAAPDAGAAAAPPATTDNKKKPPTSAAAAAPAGNGALGPAATKALAGLDMEGRVGQMLHLSVKKVLYNYPDDPYVEKQKVTDWLNQVKVGTITNTPFDGQRGGTNQTITGWNVTEWRAALRLIQEAAKEAKQPPILFGIDHLHGANYVMGATLFPQQINLAASFDLEHARNMGMTMTKDTKAAGIQWIFGPVLDMHVQPQWSRCFETFGEDPYVIGQFGKAVIEAIQGPHPDYPDLPPAAATMKHFIAYGNSRAGHDRAPVDVSDNTVRQLYAPPFLEAVRAGVKTCMECYIEVAGVPMVSNRQYLIDLLRHEMGFDGMMITDWKEMENLWTWHMVADNPKDAAAIALKDTSVDIFANPTIDTQHWISTLANSGDVPQGRVDAAAGHVLALKEYLGLFDDPFALLDDEAQAGLVASVGSAADKAMALDAARDSIVLTKNEKNTLPLSFKKGDNLLLAGKACHSLVRQSGGWTLHWQGAFSEDEFLYGTTLYQELNATLVPLGVGVTWSELPTAEELEAADAVVNCIGEGAYAEKPGDIDDPLLPLWQVQEVDRLAATGKPLVVVLMEGRPRLLQGIPDKAGAFIHAMLPGPAGGRAIADILLGTVNPSARLPFTYPKYPGTMLHQYHRKNSEKCTNPLNGFETIECPVEWDFGHGLSYTSFAYGAPKLSKTTINEKEELKVSFSVQNTGKLTGKDAVLLFVTDVARRVTPEYKLLKRFTKVELAAGASQTVSFTLNPAEDLSYIGVEGRRVLEAGTFMIGVGPSVDCRASPSSCTNFTLALTDTYHPSCQAACNLWAQALEKEGECGDMDRKMDARVSGPKGGVEGCVEICLKDKEGWGWAETKCLEQAVWGGKCGVALRCRLPGQLLGGVGEEEEQEKEKEGGGARLLIGGKSALLTAAGGRSTSSSTQPGTTAAFPFFLGLMMGLVGALSVVMGLRRHAEGAGTYRVVARGLGGGRHHVLP